MKSVVREGIFKGLLRGQFSPPSKNPDGETLGGCYKLIRELRLRSDRRRAAPGDSIFGEFFLTSARRLVISKIRRISLEGRVRSLIKGKVKRLTIYGYTGFTRVLSAGFVTS